MPIISANYRFRRLALYQRAGTYGVRIVIPKSLRSVIGKTELKRSLGMKDLNKAKLLAPPIEDKFRAIINAAKEYLKEGIKERPSNGVRLSHKLVTS